jgi:hypothetical protein
MEIVDQFSDKKNLKECHHQKHSQKNEAMNKNIMRYCPKDKTYSRSMVLTSRINLEIGIDTLGHAKVYEDLLLTMGLTHTELTLSGLRAIWQKKGYGCICSGLQTVKRRLRIQQRDKMIEGTKKMEEEAKEGRDYSSGIHLREDDEAEGENRPRKKRQTKDNNQLTTTG